MLLKKTCSLLALTAGLLLAVGCGKGFKYNIFIDPTNSPQAISGAGTATLTFKATVINTVPADHEVEDYSFFKAMCSVKATGGSVSPSSVSSDGNGVIQVVFTADNPENFEGGTVTVTPVGLTGLGEDDELGTLSPGTATILPSSGDGPIQNAERLDDNTYVIQKKGGNPVTAPLSLEDSQWYVGRSSMDKTRQALKVNIMDEDPNLSTMGWSMIELPEEIANKLTTINEEFYRKYPWAAIKFGTMRSGKEVVAHVGEGGNVKLDGSSQIWLKPKAGTRGYSGQYQFLFVFVFDAEIWDSATSTYVSDGEYTIYGNAVVNEDHPTLTWFRMDSPVDWVKVGSSVVLEGDWSDGAPFDWTKVKLVSQTMGHSSSVDSDEGYFRWDAVTQTLTSVKSAGNSNVYLRFRYDDASVDINPASCQIATGDGWPFTSFTLTPSYLVMGKYSYLSVTADTYAPMSQGNWSDFCIEIDPASDPDNNFYYYNGNMGKNGSPKPGDYNLRMRLKSNHSVSCALPVKVVSEDTPSSFTITYLHNNDYINDGNKHGVCNYGMGLPLGVITYPADAYWNWADVELEPGYDNGFSFAGFGGRDDHPRLQRTTSNPSGTTSYGTQIKFRLKYDHRKTSYIYIDHN